MTSAKSDRKKLRKLECSDLDINGRRRWYRLEPEPVRHHVPIDLNRLYLPFQTAFKYYYWPNSHKMILLDKAAAHRQVGNYEAARALTRQAKAIKTRFP